MKIDTFHHVQLGMAARSLQPTLDTRGGALPTWGHPAHPIVPDKRLLGKSPSIKQVMDISLPEMALLSHKVDHLLGL